MLVRIKSMSGSLPSLNYHTSQVVTMKATLLALLVITTKAIPNPTDREAPPASKSLLKLVKDAIRGAVDDANHIYTECIADAFAGVDSRKHESPHDVFALLPCNCLCYVCWKTPRDDLITQCEDHCEDSCRWNYKRWSGAGHSSRKRNLFEVCIGFGGSVGSDGGGGGGLLGGLIGGLLGGANYSQTKLNEAVVEDKNELAQLSGKNKAPNSLPDTGNGSVVTDNGGLNSKLQADNAGRAFGQKTGELSDANTGRGHTDGLVGNVLGNSGTNGTSDLTQNIDEIIKGLLGGSTGGNSGDLASGVLGKFPDSSSRGLAHELLEHVPGNNDEGLVTEPSERLSSNDLAASANHVSGNNSGSFTSRPTSVSYSSLDKLPSGILAKFHGNSSETLGNGLKEIPPKNTHKGLVSGQFEGNPRNYSTIVVSVELSPCNKSKCFIKGFVRGFPKSRTGGIPSGHLISLPVNNTGHLINELGGKLGNFSRGCNNAHHGGSLENAKGGGSNGSSGGLLSGLLGGSGGGLLSGLMGGGGGGGNSGTGGGSSGGGGGGGMLGGLLGGSKGGLVGSLLGKREEESQQHTKVGQ